MNLKTNKYVSGWGFRFCYFTKILFFSSKYKDSYRHNIICNDLNLAAPSSFAPYFTLSPLNVLIHWKM